MSAIKEQLKDFAIEYDEAEERRRAAKDLTRKPSAAEMILAMNAGGDLDRHIKSNVTFSPDSHPIEKVGSVFIDTIFFLLNHWECPAGARDVALAIVGLSGGNYSTFTKITQQQIADRLGVSLSTARDKLERLNQWGQGVNAGIIQIKENERNKTTRQYEITEYRPIIVKFAAEYIRRCSQRGLAPINRQKEITPKTEAIYAEIADDIFEELPEAPFIPRQTKNVTPKQTKINFIESAQDRIMREFQDLRRRIDTQSYSPEEVWKETVILAEKAFFGYD